jgi:putative ATP-dependent endonuclease of the OLD family
VAKGVLSELLYRVVNYANVASRKMKLSKIRIRNFRCFGDETVPLNDYTCLVGAKGSGKSTVLTALRIFFGDSPGAIWEFAKLQKDDFHSRNTSEEISITLTFSDLEPEAEEEFKHYARQKKLVVSAVASWNEAANCAEVKRYGERLVMNDLADYFKAETEGKKAAELKEIYNKIRESHPSLPGPSSKEAMKNALSEFESGHPELCQLGRSEDLFYGFTGGSDRLRKFIEWVFIPAVKDASTEQFEAKKTAFGLLLERTVRSKVSFGEKIKNLKSEVEKQYAIILSENLGALKTLSDSLTARLQEWAHPDALLSLLWRNDPSKNVSIQEPQAELRAGERGFQGATLDHFGHGLQRSFIFALLQELSGCGNTGNPRLLLACEEPELYQHPPQGQHLSSVLQKLSGSNSQVIVCTHSPYFISGRGFEDVRILRQEVIDAQPCVRYTTFDDLSKKLAHARGEHTIVPKGVELKIQQAIQPGLSEMFFANVLILVEGQEDLGYISSYLTLTNRYDELRRLGCHIVPAGTKGNIVYPLAVAKSLEIPTYVVFDADGDKIERPDKRAKHEGDNIALLRLCDIAGPEPFPDQIFQTDSVTVWPKDIGTAVKDDFGRQEWERLESRVRKDRQLIGAPDLEKNPLFIGFILAALLGENRRSTVLDHLCDQIISFGRTARSAPGRH